MKKHILTLALSVVLMLSLFASMIYAAPVEEQKIKKPAFSEETVVFTEMLNKNYVYNDAFVSDYDLIEGAMLSLLPQATEGRLHKNTIKEFLLDFYGIVMNESAYDPNYIAEDYYYYVPKGYDVAEHNIISIEQDGIYYTVTSEMEISAHDNEVRPHKVISVFEKTNNSSYGYYLTNCEIQ